MVNPSPLLNMSKIIYAIFIIFSLVLAVNCYAFDHAPYCDDTDFSIYYNSPDSYPIINGSLYLSVGNTINSKSVYAPNGTSGVGYVGADIVFFDGKQTCSYNVTLLIGADHMDEVIYGAFNIYNYTGFRSYDTWYWKTGVFSFRGLMTNSYTSSTIIDKFFKNPVSVTGDIITASQVRNAFLVSSFSNYSGASSGSSFFANTKLSQKSQFESTIREKWPFSEITAALQWLELLTKSPETPKFTVKFGTPPNEFIYELTSLDKFDPLATFMRTLMGVAFFLYILHSTRSLFLGVER